MQHQCRQIIYAGKTAVDLAEQFLHGLGIKILGVIEQPGLPTKVTEHRHLPGKAAAETVDSLDIKA